MNDLRTTNTAFSERLIYTRESGTPPKKKDPAFKKVYMIILFVLTALLLLSLILMRLFLQKYESYQPGKAVERVIEQMQAADSIEKLENYMPMAELVKKYNPTEAQLKAYVSNLQEGIVTYKQTKGNLNEGTQDFNIYLNDYRIAEVKLKSGLQRQLLAIFTVCDWEVVSVTPTGYTGKFSLSRSISVTMDGKAMAGTPTKDGRELTYSYDSFEQPDIILTDLFGHSEQYQDRSGLSLTRYTVSVPSDYTLQGKEIIPQSVAQLESGNDYKYVQEYTKDIRAITTYCLQTFGDSPELQICDGQGNPVTFEWTNHAVSIGENIGSAEQPAGLKDMPDVMAMVKTWNLFMTRDLNGTIHGFYKLSPNLVKNSYLYKVAYKWATGMDINYVSSHTLPGQPFTKAELSKYLYYGTTCFSCDAYLEKVMHLANGKTMTDTMHSTFFFVYYDDTNDGIDNPRWKIADIQEIND